MNDALPDPPPSLLNSGRRRGSGGSRGCTDTRRGGTSDHSEDMLHGEWGGELKAPGLNASSEYGRGECVLL